MARYQIMYWKDIPSQIKAEDDSGTAKMMLADRFQQAIDAAAMADGSTGTDAYLEGWAWGKKQDRPGSAQEVVDVLVAEIEAEYTQDRLREIVRAHKA
jgi:hypothetical protein